MTHDRKAHQPRDAAARAIEDPSGTFTKPADVLNADGLTTEEKIAVLRTWEYDSREKAVATEENMAAQDSGSDLGEVLEALRRLGAGPMGEAPGTKQGGA